MRRSPALVLLAALTLAGVTARLGFWQLDRAAQKMAIQAAIESRRSAPLLPAADLARTRTQAEAQYHRRIVVEGRWVAAQTVFLDNRPMRGRAGFIAVTPLALADGGAVLVQRGWLPRDARERTRLPPLPTPEGLVRVSGVVAPAPARLFEFDSAASGVIRQNLDLESFARETGLDLRPVSIQQTAEAASPVSASDGLLRDWPVVAANVHTNYGYAFQWFALSALTIALYVWFQLIRPRRHASRAH
jgi:surfeit locus 1 family protein